MGNRPSRIAIFEKPGIFFRITVGLFHAAALALAALVGAAASAVAEGPPKGIRAPDAWGAILPAPPGSNPNVWEVFFDHDGRLVVHYGYIADSDLPSEMWVARLYDLGTHRIIARTAIPDREIGEGRKEKSRRWEASVARRHTEKAFRYWLSSESVKPLSEEAWLERTEPFELKYVDWGLRKIDRAGNELFNVMIFFSPKNNATQKFRRGPWLEEGPDEVSTRTRALFPQNVYDLKDGTYVLTAFEEPVVIRYYGSLRSPFLGESDELLALDLAQAEPMIVELIERAETIAGRPDSRAEKFWDAFEALLTERVRALIVAKRRKN